MGIGKRLEERLRILEKAAKDFDSMESQVGWFPDARYDDNTPVAMVANIQEYGAPAAGIPPRSYWRPTISENTDQWGKDLARGVKAATQGKISPEAVLTQIGQKAAGQIREAIATIDGPPLSPVTLMLRKWRKEGRKITGKTVWEAHQAVKDGESYAGVPDQPLNDTGYMIATLTSKVVKEDE